VIPRERERERERELPASGRAEYSVFVGGLRDSMRAALCKRIYEIWPRRCHGTTYDGRIENICRTRRVGHAFAPSAVAKSRNSLENGDDGGRAREIPAADWSAIFSRDLFTPLPPGWRAGQVIYLRFVARGASCEKEKPRESDAINAERYKYQAYSVGPYTASLVLEDQVDNQRDHGHGDVTNAHRPGFQGRRSVGTVGER